MSAEPNPPVVREPSPSSSPKADEAMARCATGDDRAFHEVYDLLQPRLLAFFSRRLRHDPRRAEDLTQDTLLTIYRSRGQFRPGAAVTPWAFAIARNRLIDEMRRTGRREGVLDAGELPDVRDAAAGADDWLAAKQQAMAVEALVARLPESQRAVFELTREQGLTLHETAETIGTTVSAVKSLLHRALEAVRGGLT